MQVVSVKAIMKTESDGTLTWIGWTNEENIPEGLRSATLDALDMQDASGNRWLLATPTIAGLLDAAALTALSDGELRRIALSKLCDAELAALSLSRE